MKRALASTLPLLSLILIAGCASTPVSDSALCRETKAARLAHGAALVTDGGPESKGTGAPLLQDLKVGCAE